MKSPSIIFITSNSIDKHLSHASQMHTHTYIQRVHNSELYSGIQGRCEHLWSLVDPNYMRHVDIFSHYSLCLFLSYFLPKRLYHSPNHQQLHDRLSPSSQHHVWLHPPYILQFTPYSPVICKENFPLVYMYKSSRYYLVFNIDLGSIFPWSQTLQVLIQAPLQPSSTLATIASDFLV